MSIADALFVLLRRTHPEAAINNWVELRHKGNINMTKSVCMEPDETQFLVALQNQFPHYSTDEARYLYRYMRNYELGTLGGFESFGIMGLIAQSVENYLVTDSRNECLCRYKSLINFRKLTHPIDPLIFVSAYLAQYDIEHGFNRNMFSWSTVVRSDNIRLHHVLDSGMAENHFHIGGSSDAFIFSWICLMNHFPANRKQEFAEAQMDKNPLDTIFIGSHLNSSCFSLTFKAACIRYFLFQRLNDNWAVPPKECDSNCTANKESIRAANEDGIRTVNEDWLERMLCLAEGECDIHCGELDAMLGVMRRFCTPADDSGFIPDYAIYMEPLAPMDDDDFRYRFSMAVRNYERRLFRPIAGEQRFLYYLFRAIYSKDSRIMPYIDLAYAYMLIYCQIRGELMQINERVGFANFLQYQDRKDIFTKNWPNYDIMRTAIAMQMVLHNPQVVSFEGRLAPARTPKDMFEKINRLVNYSKSACGIQCKDNEKKSVSKKLNFVLHFPKDAQQVSDNEIIELLKPRDYKVRERTAAMSEAIIEATKSYPQIMRTVTGIDACSSEINCRPEVFAPYFRRIRGFRREYNDDHESFTIPVPHITYHAGEDFLDPIDGLRAIDEAIRFFEMQAGDRLGHALALGIDCVEWYAFKGNAVFLRKQDHLDNMVWLYGKMHQYGYFDSGAEDHIQKQFKKYFTEIYTSNLDADLSQRSRLHSVDIMDYYASFGLRGNDPMLYLNNPERNDLTLQRLNKTENDADNWKIRKNHGSTYDPLSIALYHYYHYNGSIKKKADEPVQYQHSKEIIQAVCAVQERMMYDIASYGICVECNPSSNYLIGTFKDYIKHPIFRFNNKNLYPSTHPKFFEKNPYICASINTDDLGIFGTSLENEYALMACALETYNDYCPGESTIPSDNIYKWLDEIRQNGCTQSFIPTEK